VLHSHAPTRIYTNCARCRKSATHADQRATTAAALLFYFLSCCGYILEVEWIEACEGKARSCADTPSFVLSCLLQ
jgi:hypothetical protein